MVLQHGPEQLHQSLMLLELLELRAIQAIQELRAQVAMEEQAVQVVQAAAEVVVATAPPAELVAELARRITPGTPMFRWAVELVVTMGPAVWPFRKATSTALEAVKAAGVQ